MTTSTVDETGTAAGTRPPTGPLRMVNPVQRYAWGSRHVLATLQGRDPGEHPEAELWMGAHPGAPSAVLVPGPDGVERPVALPDLVAAEPEATLGRACLTASGPRLPFLLKLLAVEKALSVQVHPDPAQAAAGYARELALGVADAAPHRVYRDPWAKPELLHAVTSFDALAGLRSVPETVAVLAALRAEPVQPGGVLLAVLQRLCDALHGAGAVVPALAALATWPQEDRSVLVAEVVAAARSALSGAVHAGPVVRDALERVLQLAQEHPADPLVLGPALLRLHRLEPGETLYVPAGVPHAYLRGVGVEVMASSDNVVRAGLTGKHVDAAALLELLDPAAEPVVRAPAVPLGTSEAAHRPPVRDFQLTRVAVDGRVPLSTRVTGPQVLLCLDGQVEVVADGRAVGLTPGRSVFLAACAGPAVLTGAGTVFRAAPGVSPG